MAQSFPPKFDFSKLTDERMKALYERVFSLEVRGADERTALRMPEEARAYAERVIRATELSPDAYDREAPFTVEDRGETWLVQGSSTPWPGFIAPRRVVLRKSDAQVMDYGLYAVEGFPLAPSARAQ